MPQVLVDKWTYKDPDNVCYYEYIGAQSLSNVLDTFGYKEVNAKSSISKVFIIWYGSSVELDKLYGHFDEGTITLFFEPSIVTIEHARVLLKYQDKVMAGHTLRIAKSLHLLTDLFFV